MKGLFVLILTDFVLTYMGVSSGIIEEANPLMVWMFELPFVPSLLLRILMGFIFLYIPYRLIKTGKVRPALVKAFYGIAYAANIGILCVHLYWIITYGMMA